jgi:hypothetical protein
VLIRLSGMPAHGIFTGPKVNGSCRLENLGFQVEKQMIAFLARRK